MLNVCIFLHRYFHNDLLYPNGYVVGSDNCSVRLIEVYISWLGHSQMYKENNELLYVDYRVIYLLQRLMVPFK